MIITECSDYTRSFLLALHSNTSNMTYISIDTKTKQARKFVELIETMPFAKILKEPNSRTKKSIEDARKGKTHKADSLQQLFTDLRK